MKGRRRRVQIHIQCPTQQGVAIHSQSTHSFVTRQARFRFAQRLRAKPPMTLVAKNISFSSFFRSTLLPGQLTENENENGTENETKRSIPPSSSPLTPRPSRNSIYPLVQSVKKCSKVKKTKKRSGASGAISHKKDRKKRSLPLVHPTRGKNKSVKSENEKQIGAGNEKQVEKKHVKKTLCFFELRAWPTLASHGRPWPTLAGHG